MVRREINWRLVIHVAALVGGLLWGIVGALALNESFGDASGSGPASWWPAVVSSAVVFAIGVMTFRRGRSIARRSVGIAAMVGALSGWYVVACTVVLGLGLGR